MLIKNEVKPMLISLLNIFLAFFFALIVLIPMALYLQEYNRLATNTQTSDLEWARLAQATGYDKSGSLAASLVTGILGCGLVFLVSYLWLKLLAKYSPTTLSDKQLKFPKMIAIILVFEVICLLIGFFASWLVPIWTADSQLTDAQKITYYRVIIYAAVGGTLGLGFGLTTTVSVIYANLRISYYAAQNQ